MVQPRKKRGLFYKFSMLVAEVFASPIAFAFALGLVFGWLCFGPYFKWSDSHSLFINTITTIVTFLSGFILLSSQKRESEEMQAIQKRGTDAIQMKLNELIRAQRDARNEVILIEDAEDHEVESLREEFKQIREEGA